MKKVDEITLLNTNEKEKIFSLSEYQEEVIKAIAKIYAIPNYRLRRYVFDQWDSFCGE